MPPSPWPLVSLALVALAESCTSPEPYSYSGDDLADYPRVAAAEDCAQVCFAAAGCRSWTWTAATQTCSLKASVAPGRAPVAVGTALSGLPCQGCLVETGVAYAAAGDAGNLQEQAGVNSHEDCSLLCQQHSGCRSWTHLGSGVCLLQGTLMAARVSDALSVSGLPCYSSTTTTTLTSAATSAASDATSAVWAAATSPTRAGTASSTGLWPGSGTGPPTTTSPPSTTSVPSPGGDLYTPASSVSAGTTRAASSAPPPVAALSSSREDGGGITTATAVAETTTGRMPAPAASSVPSQGGDLSYGSSTAAAAEHSRSSVSTDTTSTSTAQPTPAMPKSWPSSSVLEVLQTQQSEVLSALDRQPTLTSTDAAPHPVANTTGSVLNSGGSLRDGGEVELAGTLARAVVPLAALASHSHAQVVGLLSLFSPDVHGELDAAGPDGEWVEVQGAVNVELWSLSPRVRLQVKDLPYEHRIVLHIPLESAGQEGLECAYWDTELRRWATDGLTTKQQDGAVLECTTSHLTFFAAIRRGFVQSYACAGLHMFTSEAIREVLDSSWSRAVYPALYLLVLSTFLLLMLLACVLDHRRSLDESLIWTDECFLLVDIAAGKEDSNPSPPEHIQQAPCCACCATMSLSDAWTKCKESSALRDALDDVVSRWISYFSEIRDLIESLVDGVKGCDMDALEGGAASAILAAAHAVMGSLVSKTVRRRAGISLNLSEELMVFLTEDAEVGSVLLQAVLLRGAVAEREATAEEERYLAWGQLHEHAVSAVESHWDVVGHWRSLPRHAWRLFVAQVPLVNVLLSNPFHPSGLRALLLVCDLSGSFMLAALFFQASGNVRGKRSRGECQTSDVGEVVGRVLSIAISSTLLAGVPVALLSSLHSRSIKKFRPGDWRGLERQRRVWRLQDRLLWALGLSYMALCNAFVCVFLANVHPDDQPSFGTSGAISLVQEILVVPLMLAVVIPTLANSLLALISWLKATRQRDLLMQRRTQLASQGNWRSCMVAV